MTLASITNQLKHPHTLCAVMIMPLQMHGCFWLIFTHCTPVDSTTGAETLVGGEVGGEVAQEAMRRVKFWTAQAQEILIAEQRMNGDVECCREKR